MMIGNTSQPTESANSNATTVPGAAGNRFTAVDERLLSAFEAGTLHKEDWHHEAHLRIGYLYVRRFGFPTALDRMRRGIQSLNAAHGTAEAATSGYHETTTQAFMTMIAHAAGKSRATLNSQLFCRAHPELCDKRALLAHYSLATLSSRGARREFVPPDLLPLPELRSNDTQTESVLSAVPSAGQLNERLEESRPAMWKVVVAFATVYIIWGSTYLAIRFAVETVPPFLMAGVRFVISGAGLYLLGRMTTSYRPSLAQWGNAATVGCLLFVGGNGLVCWSEQTVPSGIAALIVATVPLWIVALDTLWYRASTAGALVWLGVVVGLIGVAVLLDPFGDESHRVDPRGAAALFGACFFWSLGSLKGRSADMPRSLLQTVGMQMLGGGIALLIVGSCLGEWIRLDPEAITWKSVLSLVYLIVVGGMLTFSAYSWLMRVCDAAAVSTYAYVNPVIAVFLGTWLGNEPFTSTTLIGAALILLSILMIFVYRQQRKASASS
jgi:drug/metabolite transporter (DMT)-like permease